MDKTQARKLIKDTFQGSFDGARFRNFIKNAFYSADWEKAIHFRGYIKDSFKEFIKTYERLCSYTDSDGKVIDVLIVYLHKETSLVRARTAQRNFVAQYLKDRGEKDAALAAFVSPDPNDWRFSFIKMEYKFEEAPQGASKVKENFTPARRYSFLVGKDEDSHTAQSRLTSLLLADKNESLISDIEEAFNIEKVSKEFFECYSKLFLQIKESLDENVENDAKIKADFKEHGVDTVDFAKKLLGQIVFLYFLQKKGWFGVEKDKEWGSGHKNFLRKLFDKKIVPYDNFFNDILEPLFYEALATDRGQKAYWDKLKCRIPFLNGGLFEPINGYSWETTDILLDNNLFSNNEKTKQGDTGTGVLDVFDRFNFTVKEDEPLEKEVAVDPEMLGKVFENLLGVKDRKIKGAFYTPREIVHYMCQESLINYLSTECEDKVKRSELENFIRHGDLIIENDAHVAKKGKETTDYKYIIGESVRQNACLIDEKLSNIRVCDPAVGSGAFLVGMMNEIIRARNTLTNYLPSKDRSLYFFKNEAICHCLFGVDIDPGAVEIAKLRLWLSLIVDEENTDEIKPLPNLDYKIMQGNSLLEEFEGIKLFDETLIVEGFDNHKEIEHLEEEKKKLGQELLRLNRENKLTRNKRKQIDEQAKKIDRQIKKLSKSVLTDDEPMLFSIRSEAKEKAAELEQLYDEFPSAVSKTHKQELKNRIEILEWELIETTLKEQKKEKSLKRIQRYKQANIKPFFLWKLHFGEVFREKGGFDVVIGNPPYVRVDDIGKEFKIAFKNKFESAQGKYDLYYLFYEYGLTLLRSCGSLAYISPNKFCAADSGAALRDILFRNNRSEIVSMSILKVFKEASNYPIIVIIEKDVKSECLIVREASALEKLRLSTNNHYRLFKRDIEILPNRIIPINCSNSDLSFILKLLRNTTSLGEFIHFSEGLRVSSAFEEKVGDFAIVKQYQFEKWSVIQEGARISEKNLFKVLSKTSDRYEKIIRQKILVAEDALSITATFDDGNHIPQGGIYFGGCDNNFVVLGVLNSKLLSRIYKILFGGMHMGGGYLRYRKKFLEALPIPESAMKSAIYAKEIEKNVKEILTKKKNNPKANVIGLEQKIDKLVFDLYELTPEERKIVMDSC